MDDKEKHDLSQKLARLDLDVLAADKKNDFKTVLAGRVEELPFIHEWVETELKRRDHTAELKAKGNKAVREYVLTHYWDALRDHPHGLYYFRDFAREISLDEDMVAHALEYWEHEGLLEGLAIGSWSFSHHGRKVMEAHDEEAAHAKVKATEPVAAPEPAPLKHVFIGHGRSAEYHKITTFLSNKFNVKGIEFETYKVAGGQVIPTLEKLLDSCSVAMIVATAEDDTATGVRARQNVVHEIGLFQGKFGFSKVAVLMERGIEDFSNIAGLLVVPFDKDKIEQTFMDLTDFLRNAGYSLA